MTYFIDDDGVVLEAEAKTVIGTGNFEPLPVGLITRSMINEAKWDETKGGERFISIQWKVLAPEKYQGRIVFQKLWVDDFDPNTYSENNTSRNDDKALEKAKKKRIKAKTTLLTIDMNAGGKIKKKGVEPTTADLTNHLVNKQMNTTMQQYNFRDPSTGEMVVGNWVGAVGPRDDDEIENQVLPTQPKPPAPGERRRVLDDTIPF
jgi:hypothetical protein